MTVTLSETTRQESALVEQRGRALTEARLLVLAAITMSALTLLAMTS